MELSYPFELPEATRKAIEERFGQKRRDKYFWEWGGTDLSTLASTNASKPGT